MTLDMLWVLVAAFLVFLMQAGFTMIETGYVRAKNSVNIAMKNVLDFMVATIFFYLIGFSIMFGDTSLPFLGFDLYIIKILDEPQDYIIFLFQLMFAGTAATIVSGAVAERMSFKGYGFLSIFVTALIYPVSGHWVWNEHGWLYSLGYVDFAGSSVVHLLGAAVGLVGTILIGPRHGMFADDGTPTPIPHYNLTLATLGVFLLWFGWFGFNGGSTLAANEQVPLIIVNTTIAAALGGLGALLFSLFVEKQAAVSKVLNGILGGLVGITASCHLVTPTDAAIIGLISGALVCVGEDLLIRFKIDDPVGAIPVHGLCGIFGVLAVALFASSSDLPTSNWIAQVLVQILGLSAIIVWGVLSTIVVFYFLKKTGYLRVSMEDELIGLNIAEHGVKMGWFETLKVIREIINEGDYSKRVHVEAQTEAGEVAENFNRLLDDLESKIHTIDKVSQGELEEASKYRPRSQYDRLGISVERMVKNLKSMLDQLEQKGKELAEFNRQLESMVMERTVELRKKSEKVAALLNSSGQGFLSFDRQGVIDGEYSLECENIFQDSIADKEIAPLLFGDLSRKATFEKTLNMVYEANSELQQEVFISLLESEFLINKKSVKAEYKLLDDEKIMAVLTDITEQKNLEQQIHHERKLLLFIIAVIKDKKIFFGSMDEFELFLENFLEFAKAGPVGYQTAVSMYRKVHTFKGVFLQFNMPALPGALHELESVMWSLIVEAKENKEDIVFDASLVNPIVAAKHEDLGHIVEHLGEGFISSKDDVVLPKRYVEVLEAFADSVKDLDQKEVKEGVQVIERLKWISLKRLLQGYPKLVAQLAMKLEKEVASFEIEGDDCLVDPTRFEGFTKALVHIFRNAVDHGIEEYEERLEAEKSEVAEILCSIKKQDGVIKVEVKDDGRGMDVEKIKSQAVEKGLYSRVQLDAMVEKEVFGIVFEDGFSTKSEASHISGRGVGLSALKEECEKIGGRIEVESIFGEGSSFRFYFPKES